MPVETREEKKDSLPERITAI